MTSKQASYIRGRITEVEREHRQKIREQETARMAAETAKFKRAARRQAKLAAPLVADVRAVLIRARQLNRQLRRRYNLSFYSASQIGNRRLRPEPVVYPNHPSPKSNFVDRSRKLYVIADEERRKLILADISDIDPMKHWAAVEKALRSC